jgi:anthranilate synthase/aminodeoxychorismate synthase-like glutamine amidotransferase
MCGISGNFRQGTSIKKGFRIMILLIDNYDSFVYNLARYVGELGFSRCVYRNNEITIEEIERLSPSHIILSPGPCAPNQAGISLDVVRKFSGIIPILGVCLGHQAIGQVYGGLITKAKRPMHGKSSLINHNKHELFRGLPELLTVGRYHSLIVDEQDLSREMEVIARSEEGEVMAIAHKKHLIFGVQFHPESVMTEYGHDLLRNFLSMKYADLLS